MSYLEKLKKNMNETIVDPAETTEEKVSSLKERFADLLALYLRTLGETLKNIDTEIQKATAEAKHLSVGSIFDKEFEKSVRREIDNWLLFDGVSRVRVEKVVRAYGSSYRGIRRASGRHVLSSVSKTRCNCAYGVVKQLLNKKGFGMGKVVAWECDSCKKIMCVSDSPRVGVRILGAVLALSGAGLLGASPTLGADSIEYVYCTSCLCKELGIQITATR